MFFGLRGCLRSRVLFKREGQVKRVPSESVCGLCVGKMDLGFRVLLRSKYTTALQRT